MRRLLLLSLFALLLSALPLRSSVLSVHAAAGNKVEPLSNGLALSMTASQVIAKFGQPQEDDRSVGGGIGYADFGLMFNAQGTEIWTFTIKQNVKLASGITVGSSKSSVTSTFPGGTDVYGSYKVTYNQYVLTFSFTDGAVDGIKIEPANERFVPITGAPVRHVKASAFYGTWYGTNVPAKITIKRNGTYTATNGATHGHGRYTIKNDQITFKGPYLHAWHGGRATLQPNGALEFWWKDASGAIHYFAFVKH